MTTTLRLSLFAVLAASSLALAEEGDAPQASGMHRSGYLLDRSDQQRPMRLTVHAVLPYGYIGLGGFPLGVGASFYIPLVHNGFIPALNDEFGIDFGADTAFFFRSSAFFALWVPVTVLWTFHITNTFAAYAKVGAALRIWPGFINAVFPDFVSAVGLNWKFASSMGLRVEAGYPGIKVGLLWEF